MFKSEPGMIESGYPSSISLKNMETGHFFDIHTHILPGIDDGPATIEESIEMAKIAAEDGIRQMVVTPHTLNGVYFNERNNILKKCEDLKRILVKSQVPVKIIPGSEVRMCPEVISGIENDSIMTINDKKKHIFIELPDQFVQDAVICFINRMKEKKVTPVISHPERNCIVCNDITVLERFILAGAMTQLTGESFLGKFGKQSLKCARKMASGCMINLVGSDCHSAGKRKPELSKAYREVVSLMGEYGANKIFFENPLKILN